MKDVLFKLSQGNPGALHCIIQLLTTELLSGLIILPKLEELKIHGTDIYVLWSDLCNKDFSLMEKLCKHCPDEILKDACSRQDYSGRELIKDYL